MLELHLRLVAYPAVVVDGGTRASGFGIAALVVVFNDIKEQTFRSPDGNGVADDPGLSSIPAWRPGIRVCVAIKVDVVKHQRFHFIVFSVFAHHGPDFRQIILVHDLVGLQVKGPVADAIEKRDTFLLAVHEALDAVIISNPFVPLGGDDADFGIANVPPAHFGVVVTRAERDDKLINEGKYRADGRNKWIA